jgi:hypothetical protein
MQCRVAYTSPMRRVRIIFNGVEWVAEARLMGMTIRGFGDNQTAACQDLLCAMALTGSVG